MFIRKLGLLIKVSDITSITERNYYEYSDYIHAVKIIANNKGYVFRNMEIDEVIGIIEDSPPEKEYILDLKEDKKPKALEAPNKCMEPKEDVLSMNVWDVDSPCFSERCLNVFKREGIITIGDLVQKTKAELNSLDNFGLKSFNETREVISNMGLDIKNYESDEINFQELRNNFLYVTGLSLTVRLSNILLRENIRSSEDLTKMTEADLLFIRHIGRWGLLEIKNALAEQGLRLKDD